MTDKQKSEEYSSLIVRAHKIIYKNLHSNPDPIIHSYLVTYNKKLDVIEILKKIRINDKIILQENPIWPEIIDNHHITYSHRLVYNEEYPNTLPGERIILNTIESIISKKDTTKYVSKITSKKDSDRF